MSSHLLSVCLITKNEEATLPDCLDSVRDVADEIVIVDSASTDRTMQIARDFGAEVFDVPFRGDFSEVRNIAMRKSTGEWILNMDADERLDRKAATMLRSMLERSDKLHHAVWDCIYQPHGGLAVPLVTRIVRNRPDIYWKKPVHETLGPSLLRIIPGLPLDRNVLDVVLHHLHQNRDNVVVTARWYADLLERVLLAKPTEWYAHRNLGLQFAELHRIDDAIRKFEIALRMRPDHPRNYFFLGCAKMEAADPEAALSLFQEVLRLDPQDVNALSMSALAHYANGQHDIAETIWLELDRNYACLPTPCINLGVLYRTRGDLTAAANMFARARERCPYLHRSAAGGTASQPLLLRNSPRV